MIKLKNIIAESNIEKFDSNISAAKTFNDFLNSLVGKKMKDLLDSASFARLYTMNKYGIGNADETDIKELLSQLLSRTSDYINFRKIEPLRAQLDAITNADAETPEYKEWHKKFQSLMRQIFTATKEGNTELVQKLRDEKAKLSPPKSPSGKSYSEHMNDMQDVIKHFHNSSLSLDDIMPSPNDRDIDKERYKKAKEAFNDLKNAMLS